MVTQCIFFLFISDNIYTIIISNINKNSIMITSLKLGLLPKNRVTKQLH